MFATPISTSRSRPITISHADTQITADAPVASGGTKSFTVAIGAESIGRGVLLCVTAGYRGSPTGLTVKVGGATQTPLTTYQYDGDPDPWYHVFYLEGLTGTSVTVDVTPSGDTAQHIRATAFTVVGGRINIENEYTYNINTGASPADSRFQASLTKSGYLIGMYTSVANRGPSNEHYVGAMSLDYFEDGVTNHTIEADGTGDYSVAGALLLSGVTEIGSRSWDVGSYNYADRVVSFVMAAVAA